VISVSSMHELPRGVGARLRATAAARAPAPLTQSERDFLDRMSGK
jgi:hypothetical protein